MNDNEPTAYSESNEERSDELDRRQEKRERSDILYLSYVKMIYINRVKYNVTVYSETTNSGCPTGNS